MGRLDFQRELLTIAPKAWYQKPADNRMTYPCFVYKALEPDVTRADNRAYIVMPKYEVLYITDVESDWIWDTLLEKFGYCVAGRKYVSDNLYHYPFTIEYR